MTNITTKVPVTFIRLVIQCENTGDNLSAMQDLSQSMTETAPKFMSGNLVIKLETGTVDFAASQQ